MEKSTDLPETDVHAQRYLFRAAGIAGYSVDSVWDLSEWRQWIGRQDVPTLRTLHDILSRNGDTDVHRFVRGSILTDVICTDHPVLLADLFGKQPVRLEIHCAPFFSDHKRDAEMQDSVLLAVIDFLRWYETDYPVIVSGFHPVVMTGMTNPIMANAARKIGFGVSDVIPPNHFTPETGYSEKFSVREFKRKIFLTSCQNPESTVSMNVYYPLDPVSMQEIFNTISGRKHALERFANKGNTDISLWEQKARVQALCWTAVRLYPNIIGRLI